MVSKEQSATSDVSASGAEAQAGVGWMEHAGKLLQQDWPAGCLYVVATPIGNLADLSLRAWETLRRCDAIAAEDTRTTRVLLRAWGLSTPLLAAHRHNEQQAAEAIVARLARGERIALVSDAGAPAVSDPGARIVRHVRAAGHRVSPVPGPSAVLAALMASGATRDEQPAFAFAGFAPTRPGARRKWLAHWLAVPVPVVWFEVPHRLAESAAELAELAGGRLVSVARELTKRFEQIHTLPCAELPAWLQADAHHGQGEFVLVLHAPAAEPHADAGLSAADARVMAALVDALSLRDAVRIGVRATGQPRAVLYAWALARVRDRTDPDQMP